MASAHVQGPIAQLMATVVLQNISKTKLDRHPEQCLSNIYYLGA